MDAEEKRKAIELQILKIIQERLQGGEMNAERASQIAKLVLQQLPQGITLEQFYKVVPQLDDEFSELSEAVIPVLAESEAQLQKIVSDRVQALIKKGHFTEASSLVETEMDKASKLTNQS